MTSEFSVAVHAIVFLNHKAKCMTSEEIAKNVCTNPARIRKIMAKLKKSELISTREGAKCGGYLFEKDPSKTTLLDILNSLNDEIITGSWHSGNVDMDCLIASGMAGIMDNIVKNMNDNCKEYLSKISVSDIDKMIFKK